MTTPITGSMLYDLVLCPHRVTMDLYAEAGERESVSPFLRLLWERGSLHERATIARLQIEFVDLSGLSEDAKEEATSQAMARRAALIYAGRIRHGDLLGEPDLLRLEGDGYAPGDIKSGSGDEGEQEGGRLKKHYGVQLALYADILEKNAVSAGRRGFIWDIDGREVAYDLTAPLGPKSPSLWAIYAECLSQGREIVRQRGGTLPAYGAPCKQCWWRTACLQKLEQDDDLTLIPELGRSRRDVIVGRVATVRALSQCNSSDFDAGRGKTVFKQIGAKMLDTFRRRAVLLATPGSRPYAREPVSLPYQALELFFDIEVDPLRDVCYLHGFLERRDGDSQREEYRAFFADQPTAESERGAFAAAWAYLTARRPCAVYFYSSYERTTWRKLQEKYPEVCSAADVDDLFRTSVDLLKVVRSCTEWPTRDHSIKTLAAYLGFHWRDPHPSGAASIEWYDHFVRSGDPSFRQRLLEYNEDDCRATRVLLDGIRGLSAGRPAAPCP